MSCFVVDAILNLIKKLSRSAHGQMVKPLTKVKIQPDHQLRKNGAKTLNGSVWTKWPRYIVQLYEKLVRYYTNSVIKGLWYMIGSLAPGVHLAATAEG